MPQPQGSTAVQSDARKNRKKQYHISYADPADGEVEVEVEVDVEVEVEVDVAFDGSRRSAGVGPNLYDIFFVWSIHRESSDFCQFLPPSHMFTSYTIIHGTKLKAAGDFLGDRNKADVLP